MRIRCDLTGRGGNTRKRPIGARASLSVALVLLLGSVARPAPAQEAFPRPDDVDTIDNIIDAVYDIVTRPKDTPRQTERAGSLNIPDMRMAMSWVASNGTRYTRAMSVEAYMEATESWGEVGFYEREIARRVLRYGNIAHVWSTYEFRIEPDGPVRGRGVNSFQLIFMEDRWWIASVVFMGEGDDAPIPAEFLADEGDGQE